MKNLKLGLNKLDQNDYILSNFRVLNFEFKKYIKQNMIKLAKI